MQIKKALMSFPVKPEKALKLLCLSILHFSIFYLKLTLPFYNCSVFIFTEVQLNVFFQVIKKLIACLTLSAMTHIKNS